MQISVVAVDDDLLVLDSLERLLKYEDDITLVGTARTGTEALETIRTRQPDVVLMDLHLQGDMDGVEATRRIRNFMTPPQVLAVTSFDTDIYMRRALDAGATGFLLKNDAADSLATAIRMTQDGDPMISPAMTSRLITSYIAPTADPACEAARRRTSGLSRREAEVAQLIGEGKTYQDIAGEIYISPSTVKSTIRRAMDKVGADTGAQLAVVVARARLDIADLS